MTTKLSTHFTLEEMIFSDTAARNGINNTPGSQLITHAKLYLMPGLERIRELVDKPIRINSGYRSPALNKIVPGSSDTSQHTKFEAADIISPQFGSVEELARFLVNNQGKINFDQLIYEYKSWVHVSFSATPRGIVMTKNTGTPYMKGLVF